LGKGKTLAEHFARSDEALRAAAPATQRLGRELFESGTVDIVDLGEDRIVAKVSGGSSRTVEFELSEDDFSWRCTCKKNQERFCKHAVAVALALRIDPATPRHPRGPGQDDDSLPS
jgi:uncharacterized Zn finger protein